MFERFTEPARQVVVLAQDESRAFKHHHIDTEHLLLGLLREEEGLAVRVLESLAVTIEEVRSHVGRIDGWGDETPTGQIPFTPRAKKVLELSLREALSLGHNYIGTEHILLGLVREERGIASQILLAFEVDGEKVRNEVIQMLSGPGPRATSAVTMPRGRRPTMVRPGIWEYRVEAWAEAAPDARRDALNELGAEGWQLAAVVPTGSGSDWIFKRPRRGYRWTTADIGVPGPRRALTVGQVEAGLADAQQVALKAMDAGRVTTIAAAEEEFRGLIQRVVDAVDAEDGGETGSLSLDALAEEVARMKEALIEASDFQQAAAIRMLERQFHSVLGDVYTVLRLTGET